MTGERQHSVYVFLHDCALFNNPFFVFYLSNIELLKQKSKHHSPHLHCNFFLCTRFYYFFSQNSCSAPCLIFANTLPHR